METMQEQIENSATENPALNVLLENSQDHAYALLVVYQEMAHMNPDLAAKILAYAGDRISGYRDADVFADLLHEKYHGIDESLASGWMAFASGAEVGKSHV